MHKLTYNETRLLIAIIGLIVLGSFTYFASRQKLAGLQKDYIEERLDQEALNAFFTTTDNAKAIYVYDATKQKVLFEKNADTPLPLASVTKLATALVVEKEFLQDETITISDSALKIEGDNGLVLGEKWSRDALLGFMLVISSNDAAFAFKEAYQLKKTGNDFIAAMNAYAKDIGLEHTTFSNPAGLDRAGQAGAIGSARDMGKLIEHFLDTAPSLATETMYPQQTYKSLDGKSHTISNTNDLAVHIDSLLASKTGYTNLAGGNLVIAYRMPIYGNTIIIVVLGSTREGRFVDIEGYMEGVENYFKISKK